jgi:hypothetical protein
MRKSHRHGRRHVPPHQNGVALLKVKPMVCALPDVTVAPDPKGVFSAGEKRDLSWLKSFLEQPGGAAASDAAGELATGTVQPDKAERPDRSHAAQTSVLHIDPTPVVPAQDSPNEGDRSLVPASAESKNPAPSAHGSSPEDESPAELLRRVAAKARVFRGVDGRFYAEVPISEHREVHELRSDSFEYWLIRTFRRDQAAESVPSADAFHRLVRTLEAEAAAQPSAEPVWIRVADGTGTAGSTSPPAPDSPVVTPAPLVALPDPKTVYYLDLGDSNWDMVEITAAGWRIVSNQPVAFRRPKGLRPFPRPDSDGSIDLLRKFVNLTDDDFPLLVGWMTAAWCPIGPYPILNLCGEQGSAKSTMARVVRRLIDPNVALLRALPGNQRDFMVEAHNTWAVCYDNVSSVRSGMSDALCRLATGGGLSTRALRSNDDETLLDVQRPAILTGIDDFVRRSDLIDRGLCLYPPAIPDSNRRLQKAFWAEFDANYARMLGGLLHAFSGGLRMLPQVQLPALPRMADFAQWGEAVSLGLGWQPGCFLSRYLDNRHEACAVALEECPVVEALRAFVELFRSDRSTCSGTPSQILHELAHFMPANVTRSAQWPKSPRLLSSRLRRIAPQLRTIGIKLEFGRDVNGRLIRISTV